MMKAIKKWIILVEESRKGQIVCDSEEEAKKLALKFIQEIKK